LRDALVHEWNNIPQPFIQWLIFLCAGDAKLLLLQELLNSANLLYCMTISVCPWFVLILPYLLCPYESTTHIHRNHNHKEQSSDNLDSKNPKIL
jgi:hypothetical protein